VVVVVVVDVRAGSRAAASGLSLPPHPATVTACEHEAQDS